MAVNSKVLTGLQERSEPPFIPIKILLSPRLQAGGDTTLAPGLALEEFRLSKSLSVCVTLPVLGKDWPISSHYNPRAGTIFSPFTVERSFCFPI